MKHFVSYFFLFLEMTLNEAFIDFTQSEYYKQVAKENNSLGGKFRGYLSRFNSGKLKTGAIVDLLIANGYEVKADKVEKKPSK
ncbi:MAG: hypothetical protein JWQ09_2971 [Segetibacter sp.]|nr:hypothetical protein [Segetibacter sp.]